MWMFTSIATLDLIFARATVVEPIHQGFPHRIGSDQVNEDAGTLPKSDE